VGSEALKENKDEDIISCKEEDLDEIAFNSSSVR
jgi:hypothetical protein